MWIGSTVYNMHAQHLCRYLEGLRSQHNLEAKLCPDHNFVIWSQILKLFHRNDHHIERMCHKQDLGCYLEGQGHSMTLQENRVGPITWLFEVWFYNILRWCVANNILQSPHSDYVTHCYFNLCLQQGSRDDRVSRDVFSFLYV